jgi:hypothetical protein
VRSASSNQIELVSRAHGASFDRVAQPQQQRTRQLHCVPQLHRVHSGAAARRCGQLRRRPHRIARVGQQQPTDNAALRTFQKPHRLSFPLTTKDDEFVSRAECAGGKRGCASQLAAQHEQLVRAWTRLNAKSQFSSPFHSPFNCNTLTCNPCSKVSKVDFVFIVDVTTTRALEKREKIEAKTHFSVAFFRF